MQTRSQPMTAGNMPGGGARAKKMSASFDQKWKPAAKKSKKQPVHKLYSKPSSKEKGKINQSKVAMLKAKPNRPKPLKRKKTDKLSKAEKKVLIAKRKEAKKTYADRSELVKKELVYKARALKRQKKKVKTLSKKQPKSEPTFPNILDMIYSVGPQPKYTTISKKFREYRSYAKTKLKHSKSKSVMTGRGMFTQTMEISYLYKVGAKKSPVSAK